MSKFWIAVLDITCIIWTISVANLIITAHEKRKAKKQKLKRLEIEVYKKSGNKFDKVV